MEMGALQSERAVYGQGQEARTRRPLTSGVLLERLLHDGFKLHGHSGVLVPVGLLVKRIPPAVQVGRRETEPAAIWTFWTLGKACRRTAQRCP